MTKELLKHVETNQDLFRFWIERTERLQPSSDMLAPIIAEFTIAHPEVNIYGCQECLIDMLRWAIKELKESKPKEAKK